MNTKPFPILYSLLSKAVILGVGILSVVLLGWPGSDASGPLKDKLLKSGSAQVESRSEGGHRLEFSRMDLNQGEVADFERLPGIGVVLATRIVEHRETHGPFNTVAELKVVSGIGKGKVARLRPFVTVNNKAKKENIVEE